VKQERKKEKMSGKKEETHPTNHALRMILLETQTPLFTLASELLN